MANPISFKPRDLPPPPPKSAPPAPPKEEPKGGSGGKVTDETPLPRLSDLVQDLKPTAREEKKGGPIGKEDCFDVKTPDLGLDLTPHHPRPKLPDKKR